MKNFLKRLYCIFLSPRGHDWRCIHPNEWRTNLPCGAWKENPWECLYCGAMHPSASDNWKCNHVFHLVSDEIVQAGIKSK